MRAITNQKLFATAFCVLAGTIVTAAIQIGVPPQDNNCNLTTTAGGTTTCVASGSGGGGTNQAALQGGATWTVSTDKPEAWSYLPATVTVPFGETEVVYYGEVSSTAPSGWVGVTVSGGGESRTAYIYIAE